MPQKNKHLIKVIVGLVVAILAIIGFKIFQNRFQSNVTTDTKLYIPKNATLATIVDSIQGKVKDAAQFETIAKNSQLEKSIHPGRYSLKKGMSNKDIVRLIQLGAQDEIDIRIGNYASLIELSNKVATILEPNEAEFLKGIMESSFVKGKDTAAALNLFIPNTYKFYWTTTGAEFAQKMEVVYNKFWNEDRKAKAQQLGMSPYDLTTLASIVQLESYMNDEQAAVAALYMNRLKIGMKLDADPTIIYIKKAQNRFNGEKINRVYYKDLQITSPYNTYRNKGLPPSAICMPNPSTIDHCLAPTTHKYIYFVADPQKPGYHKFAKDLKEQEINAQAYRDWANKNQVK